MTKKKIIILCILTSIIVTLAGCQKAEDEAINLTTKTNFFIEDKDASYEENLNNLNYNDGENIRKEEKTIEEEKSKEEKQTTEEKQLLEVKTKHQVGEEITLKEDYEEPIMKYYDGMRQRNAQIYNEAYPEFVDTDVDSTVIKEIYDSLEDEYGKNLEISYKIVSKEMLDKDGIESVIKTVSNKYNKNISISDGYKLKVVMTIKGDKTSEDITDIMYVYKIDDKWFYMAISP